MIYRIRIMKQVDGMLVFDRYADSEDYRELKVNPDGRVFYHSAYAYLRNPETGEMGSESYEKDVSDTCFVEWGVRDDSDDPEYNTIYEGDIVKQYTDKPKVVADIQEAIFSMKECTLYASDVIGNIWENPELLKEEQ